MEGVSDGVGKRGIRGNRDNKGKTKGRSLSFSLSRIFFHWAPLCRSSPSMDTVKSATSDKGPSGSIFTTLLTLVTLSSGKSDGKISLTLW